MTAELEGEAQLEIGHVLFMDIVGFSKLLVDQQTDVRVKPISGDSTWIIAELGCVNAGLGERAEAEKIIQEIKKRTAHEYIDPVLQGSAFHRIPGEAGPRFERLKALANAPIQRATNRSALEKITGLVKTRRGRP